MSEGSSKLNASHLPACNHTSHVGLKARPFALSLLAHSTKQPTDQTHTPLTEGFVLVCQRIDRHITQAGIAASARLLVGSMQLIARC